MQAWDRFGNVYYGGIAFNRGRPANGSIWVARYSWVGGAMPDYQGTALVARGTPSPIFRGHFNDKVMIEVDRSTAATSGNVYVCWALFTASGPNNGVFFSRSTDGGRTFSNRQKMSESVHGSQLCDIGVGSDGPRVGGLAPVRVQAEPGPAAERRGRIRLLRPTAAARSRSPRSRTSSSTGTWATRPVTRPRSGGPATQACLAGDGTLGRCAGPDPRVNARDCGDGPFECTSGYVFGRADSSVHISADPTPGADPDAAYALVTPPSRDGDADRDDATRQ